MELIADVAAVFGWPLSELMSLSMEELRGWRQRAIRRARVL
jgi:hypothetical protein